jgi:phospholipid-binding lipoprotein MlaA
MKQLSVVAALLLVISIGFVSGSAHALPGDSFGDLAGGAQIIVTSPPTYLLAQNEGAEEGTPEEEMAEEDMADEEMDFLDEDMDFMDDEEGGVSLEVADPLFYFNVAMFHFNDKLYFWIVKPLARGYNWLLPQFMRQGVRNFFYNIRMPIRLVNCLLQGKADDTGIELGRFILNSTYGVLGFRDPAANYPELNPTPEDTGQTLGKWGVGNGFYIIWPFLGPSTLRDSVGLVGDHFLHPVTYVRPKRLSFGLKVYEAFNEISFKIGQYESIKEGAIDPYLSVKDFYIQWRHKQVLD